MSPGRLGGGGGRGGGESHLSTERTRDDEDTNAIPLTQRMSNPKPHEDEMITVLYNTN